MAAPRAGRSPNTGAAVERLNDDGTGRRGTPSPSAPPKLDATQVAAIAEQTTEERRQEGESAAADHISQDATDDDDVVVDEVAEKIRLMHITAPFRLPGVVAETIVSLLIPRERPVDEARRVLQTTMREYFFKSPETHREVRSLDASLTRQAGDALADAWADPPVATSTADARARKLRRVMRVMSERCGPSLRCAEFVGGPEGFQKRPQVLAGRSALPLPGRPTSQKLPRLRTAWCRALEPHRDLLAFAPECVFAGLEAAFDVVAKGADAAGVIVWRVAGTLGFLPSNTMSETLTAWCVAEAVGRLVTSTSKNGSDRHRQLVADSAASAARACFWHAPVKCVHEAAHLDDRDDRCGDDDSHVDHETSRVVAARGGHATAAQRRCTH